MHRSRWSVADALARFEQIQVQVAPARIALLFVLPNLPAIASLEVLSNYAAQNE